MGVVAEGHIGDAHFGVEVLEVASEDALLGVVKIEGTLAGADHLRIVGEDKAAEDAQEGEVKVVA